MDEPFDVTFRCPVCDKIREVEITWAGQETYCCGRRLTVEHFVKEPR